MQQNPQNPQQPNGQGGFPPSGYPQQPGGYPPPGYAPQFSPPQPAKKRNPLLIIGGIVGGLIILCCVGVLVLVAANGNGGATSSNTGTNVNDNQTTATSTTAKHFKAGDQVKVGDTYIVTVNSVKTSKGDEILQPKAGNVYLIVDVTVKNISSKEQDLSSLLQFTLKDATGQKYDETIVTNATPPDGKIEAGDQVRGQIAYEVPSAQKSFTLAFEADIISGGQTIWDLKA